MGGHTPQQLSTSTSAGTAKCAVRMRPETYRCATANSEVVSDELAGWG